MGKPRKPSGAIPGAPQEMTPARRRANSLRRLTHGRRSKTGATVVDKARSDFVSTFGEEGAEVLEGYKKAIVEGDLQGAQSITVRALTESELLRRECVRRVSADGVAVDEPIYGVDEKGKTVVIGWKVSDHPVLRHVHKFNETLGHTAEAQLITKKSRGDAASDAFLTALLARDARLRGFDKEKMLLPPIEGTAK